MPLSPKNKSFSFSPLNHFETTIESVSSVIFNVSKEDLAKSFTSKANTYPLILKIASPLVCKYSCNPLCVTGIALIGV